ncbi:MAG: hypothetical protein JWQ89_906, partial [Devosia sp.]|nr:hypothetical protein [Devosia sp.]
PFAILAALVGTSHRLAGGSSGSERQVKGCTHGSGLGKIGSKQHGDAIM